MNKFDLFYKPLHFQAFEMMYKSITGATIEAVLKQLYKTAIQIMLWDELKTWTSTWNKVNYV